MNGVPYVDELIKEYLLFRGYVQTFSAFTTEQSRDVTRPARVEPIVQTLLNHVSELDLASVSHMWETLVSRIFSQVSSFQEMEARELRTDLLKLFLVTAVKKNKRRAIDDFFRRYASELAAPGPAGAAWKDWLALPYVNSPASDPRFAACFEEEWAALLETSLRNLLTTAFQSIPLPTLLAFNLQRLETRSRATEIRALKAKIDALTFKLSLCDSSSSSSNDIKRSGNGDLKTLPGKLAHGASGLPREPPTSSSEWTVPKKPGAGNRRSEDGPQESPSAPVETAGREGEAEKTSAQTSGGKGDSKGRDLRDCSESPFLELSVIPLEGRGAAVRCLRFSSDGRRLAAGGTGGTLRVWQLSEQLLGACPASSRSSPYDNEAARLLQFRHADAVSNATACELIGTVFCRSSIGALEWDPVSDELLLCGSHDSKIQLWSARQRRVLRTTVVSRDPAGRVVALACSPKRPLFVVSLNSGGNAADAGSSHGKLVAINLQTGRHVQNFQLSGFEGQPNAQVHSCTFNHNGNMILAGGSDGVVRIFETQSQKPIMSFPAKDLPSGPSRQLSCVQFSANETTVFTSGAGDGVVHEWSLHKLGRPLRTYKAPPPIPAAATAKGMRWYELALDSEGHHFLCTSGAPLRCEPPAPYGANDALGTEQPLAMASTTFSLYRRLAHGPQAPAPPSPATPMKNRVTSNPASSASTTNPVDQKTESAVPISENQEDNPLKTESFDKNDGEKKANGPPTSPQPLSPSRAGVAHLFKVGREDPVQSIAHGRSKAVTSVGWHPTLDVLATGGTDGTTRLTTLLLQKPRDEV